MKDYRSLIDECLATECASGHWCLLKEIVIACQKIDPRVFAQMKCVEVHMWNMGKAGTEKIRWDDAWMAWNTLGYAKRFADVYAENPDLHPVLMYDKVTA
jgi:hypothetical protein